LLLYAADLAHRPVRLDHARGRHAMPVIDVAAALLEDLEREREPGGGSPDVPQVELDLQREVDGERRARLGEDPEDRPAGVLVAARAHVDLATAPAPSDGDVEDLTDMAAPDRVAELR